MCGISGIVGMERKEPSEAILRCMLRSIQHRGPNEEGMFARPRAAAGARRLSIIDLPGGGQPIWNETETAAVVFNGEIYNFRALRKELESLGHRFRSHSDTEVIVHAFESWGEGCVRRLDGMFAFAIVAFGNGRDGAATQVFMARDRLGIKPLYYAIRDGIFYFASELRALIASGRIVPQISVAAIASYLLFGSIAEPTTLIEDVFSLPPGCSLSLAPETPIVSADPKPYWTGVTPAESAGSPDDPATHIREMLERAVQTHLVADVPVGVFLSGGIDSTAIAALASRAQGGIRTFTVAFPEVEFSEAEIARHTAKILGTNHAEVRISDSEMVSRLGDAISAFDQPSMDGVNTYFVSWAARQRGLKVALSGLGSDELFGGYKSFWATRKVAWLGRAARVVPRPLRSFIAEQILHARSSRGSHDALRKAFGAWLDPDILPHPYFFTRSLFTPQTVASRLGTDALAWDSAPWSRWLSAAVERSAGMDYFTTVSWLEIRSYLLSTLLRDTDAMSMSQSLEVRVPFLDTTLVETVLSLPEPAKYVEGLPKSLLIEAVRDLLPEDVLDQPKKTFTFPWEIWLHGKLGEQVVASLSRWSPDLEGHISARFATRVWKDFLRGHTTWSRPWSLYVLNEWTKRNLRVPAPAADDARRATAISV